MLIRPKSTIEIRNRTYKFNLPRNNRNDLSKFYTNKTNLDIHQSPKISSGKMRYMQENKKLFSLLDLNEKVTNSKGPSLPIQFKRLSPEEIHDMFNGNLTQTYEAIKKLKYSSIKDNILGKIKIPKAIKKESYIFNRESRTINNNDFYDSADSDKDKMIKIKRPNSTIYSYKLHSKNFLRKSDKNDNNNNNNNIENEKTDISEEKKVNNKNDIWMPANYKDFEQIVKDRKLFKKKMKENPFFNRLPSCTLKDIQAKSYKTDIFFVKPPPNSDGKPNNFRNCKKNLKSQRTNCYVNSDIFNLKNDEISLKKIGEKYLFCIPQKIKYTSSRESNSEWKSQVMDKSINNCSSKKYNILTPNRKNSNLAKEEFYKTLNEAKDNINNPISKPRSVSKFIDLASHSSSNFGKDYMNCYNANPNCFKKVPEVCSSFGDLYLQYKNLCDRPFYRNNIFALNNKIYK